MTYLAIVRHGQTEWNRVGVFTGWADEELTEEGRLDSKAAGVALGNAGAQWDTVYVSTLRRSAETAAVAMAELQHRPATHIVDWRINERHVGALEGALRADLAAVHGADRVDQWRWGNERPPLVDVDDPRQAAHRSRHPELGMSIPRGESLADVMARVRPWLTEAQEAVAASANVVAFTHGTTFRAIRALVEEVSTEDVHLMRPANGSLVMYEISDRRLIPAEIALRSGSESDGSRPGQNKRPARRACFLGNTNLAGGIATYANYAALIDMIQQGLRR